MRGIRQTISWQISVPILRHTLILRQLGIAIGIPFGLVALVLGLTSGKSVYTLYALGLMGALLFFTGVLIMIVYQGRYEVEYVLDEKGALCCTQTKQQKKNRIINVLTGALGLLSGKPAVAGAGVLAQSRQSEFLKWSCVTRVTYDPKQYVILLRGGWTTQLALFCIQDNYAQIEQFVRMKIGQPEVKQG